MSVLYEGKSLPAGSHLVNWDCRQAPSGLYLVRLQAGDRNACGKVIALQ